MDPASTVDRVANACSLIPQEMAVPPERKTNADVHLWPVIRDSLDHIAKLFGTLVLVVSMKEGQTNESIGLFTTWAESHITVEFEDSLEAEYNVAQSLHEVI